MAVNDHGTREPPSDDAHPRIAELYRRSSRETPPPYLDRRITAAAREESSAHSVARPSRWIGWRVPLVAAAIAVVSASLIAIMHDEDPERIATMSSPPNVAAPPSAAPAPAAESAAERAQGSMDSTDDRVRAVPPRAPDREAPHARPEIPSREEPIGSGGAREEERRPRAAVKTESAVASTPAAGNASAADASAPAAVTSAPAAVAGAPAAGPVPSPPAESTPSAAAGPPPAAESARSAAQSAPPVPSTVRSDPAPSREWQKQSPLGGLARSAPQARPAPRAARALPPESAREPSLTPEAHTAPPAAAAKPVPPPRAHEPAVDISGHVAELEKASPPAWLDRVRLLKRDGRVREAETLLTEFRRRYPAEPVPADLQ